MRDIEHKTQCACVQWFRLQFMGMAGLLFAIPNGGARDAVTGRKLKDEGVLAGVADLMLAVARGEWHGLFIEMKTKSGSQRETQKEFQRNVEIQGYKYIICRNFDEFREQVLDYLKNKDLQ